MPRPEPIVEGSFLRRADPRTKLALGLCASTAAMLPLAPLAVFFACYAVLVAAAGVAPRALARLRRMAPLFGALFAVDWLFIAPGFAVLITLRLTLLATAFTLVFATTSADEIRLTLERLGFSRRLAFALATAHTSVRLLQSEWLGIVEAQRARGLFPERDRRRWRERLAEMVALVVPAVVLATQRAWSAHEAAALRGIEAPLPRRRGARRLAALDHALLGAAAGLLIALFVWRAGGGWAS
jgi:energy-coupling factor transporter transmembrane protein EcfT